MQVIRPPVRRSADARSKAEAEAMQANDGERTMVRIGGSCAQPNPIRRASSRGVVSRGNRASTSTTYDPGGRAAPMTRPTLRGGAVPAIAGRQRNKMVAG